MARAAPIQTSVNSGELSGRMEARTDFDRYASGAKRARNVVLLPTGGYTMRPGTRYINALKDETAVGRLIPFKFSASDAAVIEMAPNAARFYRRQARIAAPNISATVSNGSFTSNIADWDDISTASASIAYLGNSGSVANATSFDLSLAGTMPRSGDLLVVGVSNAKDGAPPALLPTSVRVSIFNASLVELVDDAAMTSVVGQVSSQWEAVSLWSYRLGEIQGASLIIVTVTYSVLQNGCNVAAWAVTGSTDTAFDTDAQASTATSRAATLDLATNGVAIYLGMANGTTADDEDQTWTGATETFDLDFDNVSRVTAATETSTAASPGNGASFASVSNVARCIVAVSYGAGGVSHDASGGRLQLQATGNGVAIAQQDVATSTTGVEHVLRFRSQGDYGATMRVAVGSSSGTDDLFPDTVLGMGWHTIAFTPAASPFYVQFKCDIDSPPEPIYIDDVELLDNVPLQVTHDYSEAEIAELTYRQSGDVLYLFHPDRPAMKFERRDTRTWSLVNVAWQDGPWGPSNSGYDYSTRQLIKNPGFEDGLKDWTNASASDGTLEWDASQKIVVFGDTGGGAGAAIEQEVATGSATSTKYLLHFRALGTVGGTGGAITVQIGTTSGGADVLAATNYVQGWHSVAFTSTATKLFIRFSYNFGVTTVRGGLGGAYLYRSNAHLLELSATEGSVTATASGHTPFVASDVGRLLRLSWPGKEPCWGVITSFISTSSVQLRLRRKAPYASVPTEDWRFGEWSETTGYPTAGGFFQQRGVFGGVAVKPSTLWFTQTGDIENLRPDSFISLVSEAQDDDAMVYPLVSDTADSIRWIAGKKNLIVGTDGGHWVASSQGAAITPDDIAMTKHTETPCEDAEAISTEDGIVYIEAGGGRLFDLGFRYEQTAFITSDVSILADHVGRSAFAQIAHQKRPFSTIWVRREDGRILPVAYNRQQDIIGWAQTKIGGVFGSGDPVVESVAIIPGANDASQVLNSGERDEIWLIVKRTINAATHRYIEVMEGFFSGPVREDYATEALWEAAVKTAQQDAFYVDAGVTYEGSPTTSITGLSHLEGQSVKVLADGRIHPARTVSSGAISLAYAASKVQVGLSYDWQVETLKLPYGTQTGSGVTKHKDISDVALVLLDSGPVTLGTVFYDETEGRVVNPSQSISFERSGLAMDEAIPLFTGEVARSMESPDRGDVRLLISGSSPLPVTVLAMATEMEGTERSR